MVWLAMSWWLVLLMTVTVVARGNRANRPHPERDREDR